MGGGELWRGVGAVEELVNGTDGRTFDRLALHGSAAQAFCPLREGNCRAEGDWCSVGESNISPCQGVEPTELSTRVINKQTLTLIAPPADQMGSLNV